MPRIVEILLFLVPFVAFASWRILAPSPLPPAWLVYTLSGMVAALLLALIWLHHTEALDGQKIYVPARLDDGQVVEMQPAPHP